LKTITAIDVLSEYLSDSTISTLSQEFIEIEDPVATSISFHRNNQLPNILAIYFESVPVEFLDSLESQLFDVLREVVKDGIDMDRMLTVVEREKNRYLLLAERSPSDLLSSKLISEALYGSLDGKTLKEETTDLILYDVLSKWTSEEWTALLQRYFLN
jgi:Zn-dependent M16 (insulinase) family peptidase